MRSILSRAHTRSDNHLKEMPCLPCWGGLTQKGARRYSKIGKCSQSGPRGQGNSSTHDGTRAIYRSYKVNVKRKFERSQLTKDTEIVVFNIVKSGHGIFSERFLPLMKDIAIATEKESRTIFCPQFLTPRMIGSTQSLISIEVPTPSN